MWRDASVLMNCLTIVFVGCLIPQAPLSTELYLAVSTWSFALLATLNHLFPVRLQRLTHGVKAAYTHLLFASVGPALFGAVGLVSWWWLPVAISLLDLSPAFLSHQKTSDVAEGIGAVARWSLIGYGLFGMAFRWWFVAVYAALTWVYFVERRRRIARGARYEYGWLHCMEHVAVWLFLLVVNGPRLDLALSLYVHLGVIAAIACALCVIGVMINVRIYREIDASLPDWFPPQLREEIRSKSRANAFSHRLQHYIIKPFSPKMSNERVTWKAIEQMLEQIAARLTASATHDADGEGAGFDVLVGVVSGGAFVAAYLAQALGMEQVSYVRSRLWSRLPLHKNAVVSWRYYMGLPNTTEPAFVDGCEVDLRGKRILLVDDSVCTGATLSSVASFCRERGAADVTTVALFCDPAHPTDHYHTISKTPLVWPWGWESD